MNQINIQPIEDRLLIEVESEISENGLALPEGVKRENYRIGKILNVGEEVDLSPKLKEGQPAGTLGNNLLIGKKVIFERYGPHHLKQFNERWWLVRQQYVLAILKEE